MISAHTSLKLLLIKVEGLTKGKKEKKRRNYLQFNKKQLKDKEIELKILASLGASEMYAF